MAIKIACFENTEFTFKLAAFCRATNYHATSTQNTSKIQNITKIYRNIRLSSSKVMKACWLMAVIFVFCMQGCAPAVVATGAAAGAYVHQDERRLGQIIDDASITASIKTKLLRSQAIQAFDFNVDTRHGVVTLYGSVPSQDAEEQAIKIAQSVNGVRKIISKVTIVKAQ